MKRVDYSKTNGPCTLNGGGTGQFYRHFSVVHVRTESKSQSTTVKPKISPKWIIRSACIISLQYIHFYELNTLHIDRRRGVINFNLIRFARSWRFIATYASPVFHEQIRVSGENGQRWALQKKPNSILYGIIQIKALSPSYFPLPIPSRDSTCERYYRKGGSNEKE